MMLTVEALPSADVWKDVIRIPHHHRKDVNGERLERSAICSLTVPNRGTKFVVLHGCHKSDAIIQIDSKLRTDLHLKVGNQYDFQLNRASLIGTWRWMWNASEPMYRVPAQIGLISFVMGAVGLVLGIVSVRSDIVNALRWLLALCNR